MATQTNPGDVEVTTETVVTFDDPEMEAILPDRFIDALNLMRYFHRRDEMNAEVHYDPNGWRHDDDTDDLPPTASVRYSPITLAAERVAGYLATLTGRDPNVVQSLRFTDTEDGVRHGYLLERRLSAKDEALDAAQALWGAASDAVELATRPAPLFTEQYRDPLQVVTNLQKAAQDFSEALSKAQRIETEAEIAVSEAQRCTYVFRESVTIDGIRWGVPGDECGWNPEAGIHPQAEGERLKRGQHVWRHEPKKR